MQFRLLLSLGFLLTLATGQLSAQQWTQCSNNQGNAGRFYTHWSTGNACMRMRGHNGYSYNFHASGSQNTVGGKGWSRGSTTRKISYNCAKFNKRGPSSGKMWLTAYGWMERRGLSFNDRNRRIEYYVIDNWKGPWPLSNTSYQAMGPRYTISGEGTYQAYRAYRNNAPNYYGGNRNFVQYFSIRTSKRPLRNSNGTLRNNTISMREHFKAWNERCMRSGTHNGYQVLAVECYGTGADSYTGVWQGGNSSTSSLGRACSKSLAGDEGGKPDGGYGIEVEAPVLFDQKFAPVAAPNPTFNRTMISGLAESPMEVSIMNVTGQFVSQYDIVPGGGQHEIDLSQQKAGIYLVTLTQGTERKVLRVVRQ